MNISKTVVIYIDNCVLEPRAKSISDSPLESDPFSEVRDSCDAIKQLLEHDIHIILVTNCSSIHENSIIEFFQRRGISQESYELITFPNFSGAETEDIPRSKYDLLEEITSTNSVISIVGSELNSSDIHLETAIPVMLLTSEDNSIENNNSQSKYISSLNNSVRRGKVALFSG